MMNFVDSFIEEGNVQYPVMKRKEKILNHYAKQELEKDCLRIWKFINTEWVGVRVSKKHSLE